MFPHLASAGQTYHLQIFPGEGRRLGDHRRETQRQFAQLCDIPARDAFPAQLVYQPHSACHRRASATIRFRHIARCDAAIICCIASWTNTS